LTFLFPIITFDRYDIKLLRYRFLN